MNVFNWKLLNSCRKPTPDLLVYGSYSRGYKAGGFNLDRSALSNPLAFDPANISAAALQFDEE
ncbi:hypothetical protein, partial [Erythrobacter sp. HI0077]|uniref:hypothetical protein n=1 Tax=Erythrobacter sp. HI0077 TaxID=1822252 RepID=UPI001F22A642